MENRFYICEHCGNIITMIRDKGVAVQCCGQKMRGIIPGTGDGAEEKHVPVYETTGTSVDVRVGETDHPMTPEHYIEWICIETEDGFQYRRLKPDMPPRASFSIFEKDEVKAVYAFCNKHSLWKA